jgi:hypothetical protein
LLFEDNNADSLLAAYGRLAGIRAQLISGGCTTAKQYNWQTIAANLTDIYRGLLQ